MHQDATWYGCRPQPRGFCARWRPSPPSPTRGQSPPIFRPMFIVAKRLDGSICHLARRSASAQATVLDGDPAASPQKPPEFLAHFYCGQTAGCIKMPFGMKVGLSPGDFVLDGDPASYPKRGGAHPFLGPPLLWPNDSMDQDATWYGGRPRPTRHCVRCGPSYPQKKGHTHPAQFLAHVYCGQMAG